MRRVKCEGVGDNDGFFELTKERDILEAEYHKLMRTINEQASDIHKMRKRLEAIKAAASYRNMGGISCLSLLADIETIAGNALDEHPTNLG